MYYLIWLDRIQNKPVHLSTLSTSVHVMVINLNLNLNGIIADGLKNVSMDVEDHFSAVQIYDSNTANGERKAEPKSWMDDSQHK